MIDLHSRLVVGWSMKDRPNQELVNEALMMAVEQRPPHARRDSPQRPGDFVFQRQLSSAAQEVWDAAQHERQGQLLRQCGGGKLL